MSHRFVKVKCQGLLSILYVFFGGNSMEFYFFYFLSKSKKNTFLIFYNDTYYYLNKYIIYLNYLFLLFGGTTLKNITI